MVIMVWETYVEDDKKEANKRIWREMLKKVKELDGNES